MAPRLAPQGLSPLADHAGAHMGQGHLPAHRLSGDLLLFGTKSQEEIAGRGRSRSAGNVYEKLGVPVHERAKLAGVEESRSSRREWPWMRCWIRVSVTTTFQKKLAELGIIFCGFSEAVQKHPGTGAEVSGHGGALLGQLLSRR